MAPPPVLVEMAGPPEITPSILSAMFEQLRVWTEHLQVESEASSSDVVLPRL
jgi:hypothetical protein